MHQLLDNEGLGLGRVTSLTPWLELAADANHIGFFSWNVVLDRLHWNRSAEERMGLEPGTITSFEIWSRFVDRSDLEKIRRDIDALSKNRADRIAYKYRFHSPSGEMRIMEGAARCLYDESGKLYGMMGINFDITDRVADRDAITRSEAQLRTIVNTMPDAMIMIDISGIVRAFNREAEIMFGWSANQIIGRNVSVIMPDDAAARHDSFLANFLTGERSSVALRNRPLVARKANGTLFPIELNVGEAVLDNDHILMGFVRDVSARVEAAQRLEILRKEYLQGARLNVMGEMAAGIAHELNQPLSAAANFLSATELIAQEMDGLDAALVASHAQSARRNVRLAGDIIQRLRSFIGGQTIAMRELPLTDIVQQSLALALAGPDRQVATIVLDVPHDLVILADAVQVQQLLVNLIRNGFEATANIDTRRREISIIAGISDEQIEIRVEDNGPGFSPEMIENRNLPFETTKGAENLGLGLSICRRIVDGMGGVLSIGNRPEGGARVALIFPNAGGVPD